MLHACFYTICLVFRYTSWHFYAFFGTNLLTRCHSAVPCFLLFLCFREVTQEIFSELDETKAEHPEIYRASREPKKRQNRARGWPHHQGARPRARPSRPMVRATWSTSDAAPSPIKTPQRENPKYLINLPETYHDPPPSSTRDREGPEALLGTLPERGIAIGGLLHRHACLRRDEWVVYLGLWVHSSS
jgi:hypothetical protein